MQQQINSTQWFYRGHYVHPAFALLVLSSLVMPHLPWNYSYSHLRRPLPRLVQPMGQKTIPLQYTSAGHVLDFQNSQVMIAGNDHALRITMAGAKAVAPVVKGTASSVEAPAPSAKPTALPFQGTVRYVHPWPGVTVLYHDQPQTILRSEYHIEAGHIEQALSQIRLDYHRPLSLNSKGNLTINYGTGSMQESAPIAWQEIEGKKVPVQVKFILRGRHTVGFAASGYNPRYSLVIDPDLTWNTFLGGSGTDYCYAVALDGSGNVLVIGTSIAAWSDNNKDPIVPFAGLADAFVAKLDSNGNLIWYTFLGSNAADNYTWGTAVALDPNGNVLVAGYSDNKWGDNIRRPYAGLQDGFVAKLNSDGILQWNTFLGSSDKNDFGNAVALDDSGNVLVVGRSGASWGNPRRLFGGGYYDAFVAKVNGNTGDLIWNTFLGSSDKNDFGYAVALDDGGNVFVAGDSYGTWQDDINDDNTAPIRAFAGGIDAFVAKLASDDGSLTWNTFLGSSGYDDGYAVASDADGNVLVAGTWDSSENPYTSSYDAFVAKLDSNGKLTWNTFLGGSNTDYCTALSVDPGGNVVVGGSSFASWGTTPIRTFGGGFTDAFVAKLDGGGNLLWNAFLGGTGMDYGQALAVDAVGNMVVGGSSTEKWQGNLPPKRAFTASYDGFVAKMNISTIYNVYPDHAVSQSKPTFTLFGTGLNTFDQLSLRSNSLALGAATQTFVDTGLMHSDFDLSGLQPGKFDLQLVHPDGTYILAHSFFILQPLAKPIAWSHTKLLTITAPKASGTTMELAVGDADDNHTLDLTLAALGTNLQVAQHNPDWQLTQVLASPQPENYTKVLMFDANRDNTPEIYAATNDNRIFCYQPGTWVKTQVGTDAKTVGTALQDLIIGDGDNSQAFSLFAASSDSHVYQYRYNQNSWHKEAVGQGADSMVALAIADLNDDQANELYAANADGHVYQFKYINGAWHKQDVLTRQLLALAVGDIDQNNQSELYGAADNGEILQLAWDSGTQKLIPSVIGTQSGTCHSLLVSDADNDGQDELYACSTNGHVYQYSKNGSTWSQTDLGDGGEPMVALAVGDADQDNRFEVYALSSTDSQISLYQFKAFSTAPTPTPTPTPGPDNQLRIINNIINPLHGQSAKIRWYQSQSTRTTIKIYTMRGQLVKTLADGIYFEKGQLHEIDWNGMNTDGSPVASGIYIVRIQAGLWKEQFKVGVVK